MRRLKTTFALLGAATVLVLAGNTLALAATGHALVLGQVNKANQQTVLKRTTAGPALNLTTTSSTAAPLSTNGRGRVLNLNADLLDGLSASAFMPRSAFRTLVFDSAASPNPPLVNLGTVLGATFYADCVEPNPGEVRVRVYLQTASGAWEADYMMMTFASGTTSYTSRVKVPAGTYSLPSQLDFGVVAVPFELNDQHVEIIQLAPRPGHLSLHATASSGPSELTCHLAIQAMPGA